MTYIRVSQKLLVVGGLLGSLAVQSAHAAGPTLTTLASFDAHNGANPFVTLARDGSGNLFGTTEYGGAAGSDQGALFVYNTGTGLLTAPILFNGTNGANPIGSLLPDGKGSFYGTTRDGGPGGAAGTIFKYSTTTQSLTTLFGFDGSNGSSPYAGVITDGKGDLFGTTNSGGTHGLGTVFELNIATQKLTTLANFNGKNGADPFGGLVMDGRGNLYGTTRDGGAKDKGTVFKITAETHALTTLVTFNGANGEGPTAGLTLGSGGTLYGTTVFGGTKNDGVVFRITSKGESATLASFSDQTGQNPIGDLLVDAKGNLFGTTQVGGSQGGGTVFRVSASAHALTTVASFDYGAGWGLDGGLIADGAGNLYGTTYYGGANHNASFFGSLGNGTLFEISNTGFVVVPEPASLMVLAVGVGALAMRKRRREYGCGL